MKMILVVLDGPTYQVAYGLQRFRTAGRGQLYRLQYELPSLSRPLYEYVPPVESGIVHNQIDRLSNQQSTRAAQSTTAAAAYHWISELYNRSPCDVARDHHIAEPGINNDLSHVGLLPKEYKVPLFAFGKGFTLWKAKPQQTKLCGTICERLSVPHDKTICREFLS